MSKKRKDKVALATEEREKRLISPKIKIGAPQQSVERLDKAEDLGDISQRKVADVHISPVSSAKVLDNSASNIKVPATTPIMKGAFSANGSLPNATTEKTPAQTGVITKTTPEPNKPMTLSDYLSERREALKKEKTDAVKMQKYYALTDALKSLGQMAGTAVGGAIGGNAIDSAPKVEEYKESRGYIDAFERAKQANEKLRALDDKEYDLAYAKQQRDEEREFKLKVDQLDKQWQKDMIDYKSKIEQAATEKNLKLKAKYEAEAAALTQKYWKDRAEITHGYTMDEKRLGNETVQNQYKLYNTVPIGFKNGTGITIPKPYYEDMLKFFIDEENGVDKDNVATYIRNNPDKVNAYLKMFGLAGGTMTPASAATSGAAVQYPFPYHISQIPVDQMNMAPSVITIPENATEQAQEDEEIDYSQYKQAK